MKIIRYSTSGFKPQYQKHHLNHVNFHLFNFDISTLPKHLKQFVIEDHNILVTFYREHYNDFKYGIWAFIDGYKDNMSLNHLKRRVPCWSAEISEDIYGYDCNWREKIMITDWKCQFGGIYIPEHQLGTLTNIQRVIKIKQNTLQIYFINV